MKYFDNLNEINRLQPSRIRNNLDSLFLDGLSVLDKLRGVEFYLNKPRVQFLYIHHVFKDEESNFNKLLHRLSLNHQFISYSDAIEKILTGNIDKPYISISSDDGFKNNIRAAKILNNFNISACFFINPAIIGVTSYNTIERHCKVRLNFPPVEFMDWNEIEKLQKWGHEIGSHTMEHINVANTSNEIFSEDCKKTFEILQKRCGEAKHFAFPYGRFHHINESGRKIIFNSGFISCASAERGCHINHNRLLNSQELFIRRDHVVLGWKTSHVLYFLANNSRNATILNNIH